MASVVIGEVGEWLWWLYSSPSAKSVIVTHLNPRTMARAESERKKFEDAMMQIVEIEITAMLK